ncbi:hypothetical protein C8Q76DRAFT_632548, partial [Earliella scabrosa]
ALIIYEHILTAQQEYQVIWKRKLSLPIVLYILNRYALLGVGALYIITSYLVWLLQLIRCFWTSSLQVTLLALRIHAINNQNWYWTAIILSLGLVSVPANSSTLTLIVGVSTIVHTQRFADITPTALTVTVAVRIARIVQDIIVLGITWYRTFGTIIAARRANFHASVVSILLRDGELRPYSLPSQGRNTKLALLQGQCISCADASSCL